MIKEGRIVTQKLIGIVTKREKPIEIPEEWINPSTDVTDITSVSTPVAVEPTIVFEDPSKRKFALSIPWVFGMKRILAFLLLISTLMSMYLAIISYPLALIPICPSIFIFIDYLMLTRPTEKKVKWYILQNLEEEK